MKNRFAKFILIFMSLFSASACNKNEDKVFKVEYEQNEYVRFNGQSSINYGQTLVCKLTYLSENDFDYSEMKIFANDKEIAYNGGSFVIENVKSDLYIRQEGARFKRYTVTFENNIAASLDGEPTAEKYQPYSFKINKLDTTNYDYSDMKVLVNNEVVTPVNDVYTVNNVKSNLYIVASDITSNSLNVTFVQTSLFRFNGEAYTKKNSTYSFTLTILDDLINKESVEVKVNDTVVVPVNGTYTYNTLREDLFIEVSHFEYDDPTKDDDENKSDNPVEDLD